MAHVAVVGCGAIGGLAGFYMARAGERVLFVDRNADHVRAIRERGISVNGVYGPMAIAPHLADGACVVSLQNGMNEDTIAGVVGRGRTMGALPDYGGAYLDPGVLE